MPRLTRALCVASALGAASAVGLGVVENLVFAALSDWGGQGQQPFTTPGQLASAASLGRVADSLRPKFVLSAGGNFLPQGLPGARRTAHARRAAAGAERGARRPGGGRHATGWSAGWPQRAPHRARASGRAWRAASLLL